MGDLRKDIWEIVCKIQQSSGCHGKYMKKLENLYKRSNVQDFTNAFTHILQFVFSKNSSSKEKRIILVLQFLTSFVAQIKVITSNDDDDSLDGFIEDSPTPDFFTNIITSSLKFISCTSNDIRINSSKFVNMSLEKIGHGATLDNNLCDNIEIVMLERLWDTKFEVKSQAIKALTRLQDPELKDCPVIKNFVELLLQGSSKLRNEVLTAIAVNAITIPSIISRLRDEDRSVRLKAYSKLARVNIKRIKIIDRQLILNCGLTEKDDTIRSCFVNALLPNWVLCNGSDYLVFLNCLKYDGDEDDMYNTDKLIKETLKLMLRDAPIGDLLKCLSLKEDTKLPEKNLTYELSVLWSTTVKHLRQVEGESMAIFNENITSLTLLCNYIKKFLLDDSIELEALDRTFILYNLFEIAEGYDFSDVIGRKTLHQLLVDYLQMDNRPFKLTEFAIKILYEVLLKKEEFITTICNLLFNYQERFEEISLLDTTNLLKFKEETKYNCICLDVIIATLKVKVITSMDPFLRRIFDEFILPLLKNNNEEVHRKVVECVALFMLIDEKLAKDHLKFICFPILCYKATSNYNKYVLISSIYAICDLYRVWGTSLFNVQVDDTQNSNEKSTNRRRLYSSSEESEENQDQVFNMQLKIDDMVEMILDIGDDELNEIKEASTLALKKLIIANYTVSPALFTRLILKYYNPLTYKSSSCCKYIISDIITVLPQCKNVITTFLESIIPIFKGIANAPPTSPLRTVDANNLTHFLASMLRTQLDKNPHMVWSDVIFTMIKEARTCKNNMMISFISKMILQIGLETLNASVIKEIEMQINLLLETTKLEKVMLNNFVKFREKLKKLMENEAVNPIDDSNNITNHNENSDESSMRNNGTLPQIREIIIPLKNLNLSETPSDNSDISNTEKVSEEEIINSDVNGRISNESEDSNDEEEEEEVRNYSNKRKSTCDEFSDDSDVVQSTQESLVISGGIKNNLNGKRRKNDKNNKSSDDSVVIPATQEEAQTNGFYRRVTRSIVKNKNSDKRKHKMNGLNSDSSVLLQPMLKKAKTKNKYKRN